MRGWRLAAAPAALCLATACRFGEQAAPDEALPTALARRGEFRITVEEVGVAKARSSVQIRAPFYGKILRIVPEGTAVAAGEPVLWLDATEKQRDLDRLAADASGARSEMDKQLARIELQRGQRKLDLERSEANLRFERGKLESKRKAESDARRQAAAGLVAETALERAEGERMSAELSAKRAELSHERKQEEVASQERQTEVARREAARRFNEVETRMRSVQREVDSAVLRAPAAGVVFLPKVMMRGAVEMRQARVGDQVGRWSGALMELPDPGTLEVKSQVDESLVAAIVPGLPATIRVTAIDGLRIPARVASLGALAIPRSKSEGAGFSERGAEENQQVVFPVTLELLERDPRLQPGMTVAVSYVLQTLPDAVFVPEDAIFGGATSPVVFVVEGTAWRAQPVELGPSSTGRVVVEQGLSGGETIYLGDPRRQARGTPRAGEDVGA